MVRAVVSRFAVAELAAFTVVGAGVRDGAACACRCDAARSAGRSSADAGGTDAVKEKKCMVQPCDTRMRACSPVMTGESVQRAGTRRASAVCLAALYPHRDVALSAFLRSFRASTF